uniref:tumor necrosis factor receptor superfamily member 5 isoform X2 n=1 Tax=Monopterus albus TaxID=43700 RepID=UPI0009B2FBED|nr:tumor necrosis factor receptor superfamily member 5-like isoform X2 [Monopterus albus]
MGLVHFCVIVLMFSAQLVLNSPVIPKLCPAGEYLTDHTQCEPCPAGSYTTERNREDACYPCFADCIPAYHLKVVHNCTCTSNLKCVCEEGFRCIDKDTYTGNCKECVKNQETSAAVARVTSGSDKQTSSTSSQHSSTSAKPCRFPKCEPRPVSPTPTTDTPSSPLAVILCPVVVVGCVALVILFCIRHPGDETCFKRAVAKLCKERGHNASVKSRESTHQFPRDSFSAKQQPPSLSAATLGPVHVHNPGTVIFSLLSQFTGQVGSSAEGGKTAARMSSEEDERDCPVFHPTCSPGIPPSEEERSSIFFPSQEQGKDCHMSKEEEL